MKALIPARQNSKRLKNKNVRLLGSKPLIRWTIDAALESECFEDIYVCSDDIAAVAMATSPVLCWKRDPVPDDQRDIEWLSDFISSHDGEEFCVLRPTSPFRGPETVRRALDQWEACKDRLDSLRAMRRASEHAFKQWIVEGFLARCPACGKKAAVNARLEWIECCGGPPAKYETMVPITTAAAKKHLHSMPTQALTTAYIQTAGLEITKRSTIEAGTLAGDQVGMFLVEGPEALDLNDERDWAEAERIVSARQYVVL